MSEPLLFMIISYQANIGLFYTYLMFYFIYKTFFIIVQEVR